MSTDGETWAVIVIPLENLRSDAIQRPDLPWPERREHLRLELSSVTANSVFEPLMDWLDGLSDADRAELLASEGLLTQAYQLMTPIQPGSTYDANAWFAFLAEHGPQWDGTEESWDGFREWFGFYAAEAGFREPCDLLMDYLASKAAAERIALFAEYGVTIQTPATGTLDPRAQRVMAALLARKPEYVDIPEARRIELVTAYLEREDNGQ